LQNSYAFYFALIPEPQNLFFFIFRKFAWIHNHRLPERLSFDLSALPHIVVSYTHEKIVILGKSILVEPPLLVFRETRFKSTGFYI